MNVNDLIYIYKTNTEEVLLKDYKTLLTKSEENKEEIINIFLKKFKYDFLESSQLLIDNNNLYPALMILVNSIDVLAKHYQGNITTLKNKVTYTKFFKNFIYQYFKNLDSSIKNKEFTNIFYTQLRCGITHSNSTKVEFTLDEKREISIQNNIILINIKFLRDCIIKAFINYINCIKENKNFYENFIKVQKSLYF